MKITLGLSDFFNKHSRPGTGNSYCVLDDEVLIDRILQNWHKAVTGAGETTTERKILVPMHTGGFFCPPQAKMVMGMPVNAEIVQRQDGEEPYLQTYVTRAVAEAFGALIDCPAKAVDIVCYSADALEENNGKRSTDCDWEVVTVLCRDTDEREPMLPLAMARNMLEKAGGTMGTYTAKEFAEAIWHHSTQKGLRVKN